MQYGASESSETCVFIERRVDTVENNVVWHVVVKTRNERIVCIQTQNGVRAVLRADAQLSERMRDLAVAVKLVAEDVRVVRSPLHQRTC